MDGLLYFSECSPPMPAKIWKGISSVGQQASHGVHDSRCQSLPMPMKGTWRCSSKHRSQEKKEQAQDSYYL